MSGIEDQGLRPENVDPAPADAPEDEGQSAPQWHTVEPESEDSPGNETHTDPSHPGHTSQAEGEDPARTETHPDPATPGHPSQAEGEAGHEKES